MDTANLSEQERFAAYLHSRSKEELVTLVLNFAPAHYRKQIELLSLSPERVQEHLNEAKQNIERLEWMGYDTFERVDEMLVAKLIQLRPFWKTHPGEVLSIYRDVAVSMQEAQEEGGLYDEMEDVYMEPGWPTEVLDFLAQLDEKQHAAAIKELSGIRESLMWISAEYVVDGA